MLFDRVWSCLVKFEGHQTTQNISFVLVFDVRCFVHLDSRTKQTIKHVWRSHAYDACSGLVSIEIASCLRTALVPGSILKMATYEEALIDVPSQLLGARFLNSS